LQLCSDELGIDLNNTFSSKKINLLVQTAVLKGLLTDEYKLTTVGNELLDFSKSEDNSLPIKKTEDDSFLKWWKAYPGTDAFIYSGITFSGSRSLRVRKEDCRLKLKKILEEGEYAIEDLISALELEVNLKKEASVKNRTNKLSFMQNSLTYLNQRTFEPFIEQIKEGMKVKQEQSIVSSTDI
jgi:hypothetical protein